MQLIPVLSPISATIEACIFDVDGVLLASPHERAWREAVCAYADSTQFTAVLYQAEVAGKPRLAGAQAALGVLGVADVESKAVAYADRKQQRFKDANEMLGHVRLHSDIALLDVFGANVCGRDLAHGKPDPEIFLLATVKLGVAAEHCLVFEDATAGIEAARAGGTNGVGIARFSDARCSRDAGVTFVIESLDDLTLEALRGGSVAGRVA